VTYKSGPEQYAPPNRRPAEPQTVVERADRSAIVGNVRELVPRDVQILNRQSEVNGDRIQTADSLNALIERTAGSTMDEIDRVISEFEGVREMLRSEGDRVTREIAKYASLNRSATTVMKVIGDSVKQWKDFGSSSPSS
jgi:hypothetical protein